MLWPGVEGATQVSVTMVEEEGQDEGAEGAEKERAQFTARSTQRDVCNVSGKGRGGTWRSFATVTTVG